MEASELIRHLDSAFAMRKSGDSAGALNSLEHLERQSTHPRDIATLRLFQVMCLTDLGRADEAHERIGRVDEKRLDIVDRIDYESEYAYINRAEGRTNEALERVELALKMTEAVEDKRRVEAARSSLHALHGVLLAESGKCDDAMPILEEVTTEDIWWADARRRLGDCSYRNRRYREAIDYYLSLTCSNARVSSVIRNDALRNIGFAYHQMENYTKAAEYLSKVKNAYDDYPTLKAELFAILASVYSHLGMTQEAIKYSGFSRGTNSVQ